MMDHSTNIAQLKAGICQFAAVRGWEPYHTPKNLVMALASEVGELCHLFRWLSADESLKQNMPGHLHKEAADELADIANIVFLLADRLGLDLSEAIANKMQKNALKYPASGETGGPGVAGASGDAG